jgi:hypothetical protein
MNRITNLTTYGRSGTSSEFGQQGSAHSESLPGPGPLRCGTQKTSQSQRAPRRFTLACTLTLVTLFGADVAYAAEAPELARQTARAILASAIMGDVLAEPTKRDKQAKNKTAPSPSRQPKGTANDSSPRSAPKSKAGQDRVSASPSHEDTRRHRVSNLDPEGRLRAQIVERIIARREAQLDRRCGPATPGTWIEFELSIDNTGRLAQADVVQTSDAAPEPMDCTVKTILGWRFPRPGDESANFVYRRSY